MVRVASGDSLGARVRAGRVAAGLTLAAVADLVGCSKSYLSEIENDKRATPPGDALLARIAGAIGVPESDLLDAARWQAAHPAVRRELTNLEQARRAAERLADAVRAASDPAAGRPMLDELYRSGELRRLAEAVRPGPVSNLAAASLPLEVPVINRVAAGYPREFTDLGYPARVADEYIRCPDLDDPDAFAARVVGDSMEPDYREGDVVVFSPARPVRSGMDCFARLEPDHQTTFKRAYFEAGDTGVELIRLQPLNSAYPPRLIDRELVAGLYAAVSVIRRIG